MPSPKKTVIRIPDPSQVFNKKYLPFALDYEETQKPIQLLEGGRGSGKSREIAQKLVKRSLENKLRILLIRKVADTIRDSQYRDIKDVVEDWGLMSQFRFIASPLSIRTSSDSEFICRGLDVSTKVKSIANVDIIWVEEAEELTKQDWTDLSLSIRGTRGERQKTIIISFNRKAGNWTETEFFDDNGDFKPNKDIYHLHTTYKDNKFLDQAFLNRLDDMKKEDFDLWQKNALGLPIRLKGLIYENWDTVDVFPEKCKQVIYGLDFGFNDPMVLTKCGRIDMDLYLECMYYETKKTTGDLIKVLPTLLHHKHAEIYCDTAEPDRIEELYRAGFNSRESEKSVEDGIDVCKRFKIHLVIKKQTGTKAQKDLETYKWAIDKQGISLDKPHHSGSHFPDSFRYPVFTRWGKDFRYIKARDMRNVAMVQTATSQINY